MNKSAELIERADTLLGESMAMHAVLHALIATHPDKPTLLATFQLLRPELGKHALNKGYGDSVHGAFLRTAANFEAQMATPPDQVNLGRHHP